MRKKHMSQGEHCFFLFPLPSIPVSSVHSPSPLGLSASAMSNPPLASAFIARKQAFPRAPLGTLIPSPQPRPVQHVFFLFQLVTSFEAVPSCCGILSSAEVNHQNSDLVLMGNVLQEMAFPFRESQASVLGSHLVLLASRTCVFPIRCSLEHCRLGKFTCPFQTMKYMPNLQYHWVSPSL